MCGSDVFLGLIAILFPPIAVWVKRGICSADSFINLALCCLGFFPGLLHAWYIISQSPDPTYQQVPHQDAERGQVTYYYVQQGQPQYARQGGQRQYGTVAGVSSTQPAPQQAQSKKPAAQTPATPHQAGASSSDETPPSYAQAVAGDNKLQQP